MKFKISVGLDLNYNCFLEKYFNIIDETKNLVYFYKINPYLGSDALKPFFDCENKLNFILCRTTNKGSELIQNKVYKNVYDIANRNKVHLVIPSNKKGCLEDATKNCPDSLILSPGIGKQGGKIKNISKEKIIYSISRSIINSDDPKKELEKYVNS